MCPTFPPCEPTRHSCVDLAALVRVIRRIAFDPGLDDADRARRLRDALNEAAGVFRDPEA